MDLMKNIRELQKQAEEVAAQPNIANQNNAGLAGEQQAVNALALQAGGTVEQGLMESLQKGLNTQSADAGHENKVLDLEKAAAVVELVQGGADFYDAVNAVADADSDLQKQAALSQLMDEGQSFEDAVAMIQQATL